MRTVLSDLRDLMTSTGSMPADLKKINRREALEVIAGLGAIILSVAFASRYARVVNSLTRQIGAPQAKRLFADTFAPPVRSGQPSFLTTGRKDYSAGTHPDNEAAGGAVLDPFEFLSSSQVSTDEFLSLEPAGNLVVVGGTNSNLLTMLAWEFDGPDLNHLHRPEERGKEPIIPLRWFGVSDREDPSMLRQGLVGWNLERVGRVTTTNWGLIDTASDKPIYGATGDEFTDKDGRKGHYIQSNFLIVTRLPNFLSRDFATTPPEEWPTLVVFQGMHGIGTRAIELLSAGEGLQALRDARKGLGGCGQFQLKFTVSGRQPAEQVESEAIPYDRFTKVQLDHDGVHRLELPESKYIAAHVRLADIMVRNGLWHHQ